MWVNGQTESSKNDTKGTDIDGQTLYNFGRKYNKPMLSVIGRALLNLHSCAEWTQWTTCETTRVGYYSVRKRTRSCGQIDDTSQDLISTVDEDFSFCEGRCPYYYNVTTNGYCMKLYIDSKDHDDAEKQCESDGGYLVNIDSSQKYNDVKGVLTGYSQELLIGGRRKDSNSKWEYKYGSKEDFFSWYSGYPRSHLCLALTNPRLFFDLSCSTSYPYICEIPL
jgi:hypothetical protein